MGDWQTTEIESFRLFFVFHFLTAQLWKMIPSLGEMLTSDMSSHILPPHVSQGGTGWDLRRGDDVNESSHIDPKIHKQIHRRSESGAWQTRLEQSLRFGSYKAGRNREDIDLGKFIHKTHRKRWLTLERGGHDSILEESKRTNRRNWERIGRRRQRIKSIVPEANETASSRKKQCVVSLLQRRKMMMETPSMSIKCQHWSHLWL